MHVAPMMREREAATPDNFRLANCIRALTIDGVEAAKSGHPGAPLGMADAATVLFSKHLKFDASRPDWPDRDRFVLSNGHASLLLYALLYLTGYQDMPLEQLKAFRSGARVPPAIPNTVMPGASRRPPVRLGRASPARSAWRWPNGGWPTSSVRTSSIITPSSSLATAALRRA